MWQGLGGHEDPQSRTEQMRSHFLTARLAGPPDHTLLPYSEPHCAGPWMLFFWEWKRKRNVRCERELRSSLIQTRLGHEPLCRRLLQGKQPLIKQNEMLCFHPATCASFTSPAAIRLKGTFFLFLIKKFFLIKNLKIVDLHCCVNFCCIAKWFSYTYILFFLIFFSIMVYHRKLNIVLCATQ